MNLYLKNKLKRIFSLLETGLISHKIRLHSVNLDTTDDSIVFNTKNYWFFGEKYLLIKHRNTGKRISKPIKNSNVKLYGFELENMNESGIFDIYLKVKSGRFEFVERTKYESINKNKYLINRKDKTIFSSYKTAEADLSFNLRKALFTSEITLKEFEKDEVHIEGVLDLFENLNFDSIELAFKSEEINGNKIFNCEYTRKENFVHYKVTIKLKMIEKYRKTNRLSLRLKNNDIIQSKETLKIKI